MSWTDPPTFVSDTYATAAQLNILGDDLRYLKVRDSCRCYAGTSQAITNSSVDGWQRVNFSSESYDSGLHTAGTAWKFLVVTAGVYVLNGQAEFAPSAADSRRTCQIRKNDTSTDATLGGRIGAQTGLPANSGSINVPVQCTTIDYLNAGDFVSFHVWQNSGSTLNVNAGNDATYFSMVMVSD